MDWWVTKLKQNNTVFIWFLMLILFEKITISVGRVTYLCKGWCYGPC